MRGLGLLFVMVMVNSEHHSKNAAGLQNSAGEGTQSYNHEHNQQGSFSSTNV